MKFLHWFNTTEVDALAHALAVDMAGRFSLPAGGNAKPLTPEQLRHAHGAIIARASAFARNHKLNFYQKAHLGNTFRWALAERGCDKNIVESWTQNLLIAVANPEPRATSEKKQKSDTDKV